MRSIDLNSDLGEGYGPWSMGDDAAMLSLVTSANVACGGHASDPDTMCQTLTLARDNGVTVGAHPGYSDLMGFGRRVIPMQPDEIARMVASQIGALLALAQITDTKVAYVKPHGALANLAAADRPTADAIADVIGKLDPGLAVLAISGTVFEGVAREKGMRVFSEIFADRGYLSTGQLVPRGQAGAMIHDADEAADRLLRVLETGQMPVIDGDPIPLEAHSICVHGDSPTAVGMAAEIRDRLTSAGVTLASFVE